jgi:hypothetical protein
MLIIDYGINTMGRARQNGGHHHKKEESHKDPSAQKRPGLFSGKHRKPNAGHEAEIADQLRDYAAEKQEQQRPGH